MANFDKFFTTLLKHEGGWVDHPLDRGSATNYGITIGEWLRSGYDKDKDGDIDKWDLKKITPEDAKPIAKRKYWDKINGDVIKSQSVAEFLMDWAYLSGSSRAIKKVQEILGLTVDGVIGTKTITAINSTEPKILFTKLKESREKFFYAIVANNPSQKVFLKGWLNRNNSFKFTE